MAGVTLKDVRLRTGAYSQNRPTSSPSVFASTGAPSVGGGALQAGTLQSEPAGEGDCTPDIVLRWCHTCTEDTRFKFVLIISTNVSFRLAGQAILKRRMQSKRSPQIFQQKDIRGNSAPPIACSKQEKIFTAAFHLWKDKAGNEIHILSAENLDLLRFLLCFVEAPQALD